jgi:hypothetical protein
MALLHTSSLSATVDAVNEAAFFEALPAKTERREAARWIASRRGMPGSYAGMFAPTDKDLADGLKLFTGERIDTDAGVKHILGEEACRALLVLGVDEKPIREAVSQAGEGLLRRMSNAYAENQGRGTYCCGKCSVSLWRHLAAGGLNHQERRLAHGLAALKMHRDGDGRWKVFPFHYTLLALTEIDLPAARAELKYAAGICERALKRKAAGDKFSQRRRALAERVLGKC